MYLECAQFPVVEDQLRMLLFFPITGAAILIIGCKAAWGVVLAAISIFSVSWVKGGISVSPMAFSTFVITISVTGLFFNAFSRQAERALRMIAHQVARLEFLSKSDPLTGVSNVRAFHEEMEIPCDALASGEVFSSAFVDVDKF